jgi:nucleoside-diphosphate-sugar epimerase
MGIVADFSPEHKKLDNILIIGCGDIGRRVAERLRRRGAFVTALSRGGMSAETLSARGLHVLIGDLDHPSSLPNLPARGGLLFYFAPPPAQGRDDPRLRALLDHLGNELPRRIVYISTSAVYGDRGGAWVAEGAPPMPRNDRARRRLAAEEELRRWSSHRHRPVAILRVGGIYGRGRLPVDRIRRGEPVLRESDCGYTNRIHAEDLAVVCIAAGERGDGIYNVSDGRPGTLTDYFNRVADLYGLPRPPQITLGEARTRLSAEMLSYLGESRRLDNGRMLRELGVSLRYPDLREGLRAASAAED